MYLTKIVRSHHGILNIPPQDGVSLDSRFLGFFFFFLIELSFGFQCHIMIVRSFHLSNVGAST